MSYLLLCLDQHCSKYKRFRLFVSARRLLFRLLVSVRRLFVSAHRLLCRLIVSAHRLFVSVYRLFVSARRLLLLVLGLLGLVLLHPCSSNEITTLARC